MANADSNVPALAIDPFDSNHWLYGTGATIYGSHDLKKWDTAHNVTLRMLADGIEETSVRGLISPPTGPNLLSGVADITGMVVTSVLKAIITSVGFVHDNLDTPRLKSYDNPKWMTSQDIDYAGNLPTNIVRIGAGDE